MKIAIRVVRRTEDRATDYYRCSECGIDLYIHPHTHEEMNDAVGVVAEARS